MPRIRPAERERFGAIRNEDNFDFSRRDYGAIAWLQPIQVAKRQVDGQCGQGSHGCRFRPTSRPRPRWNIADMKDRY